MQFLSEDDPRRQVWAACESPIEQILCCGLFVLLGCKAVSGPFNRSRLLQLAELAGDLPACFLFAQHSIGAYRADFLAVVIDPVRRTCRRLVIECDGKDYHDSDEQIARDAKRDREIEQGGYRLVRYSGSVIHGNLRSVLAEIRGWIEGAGATCSEIGGYAGLLLQFTPDRVESAQRVAERRAYWEDLLSAGRSDEPDFVDDHGFPGRWSDTL
jgi:very-short-patch-repair endonuclease